MRVCVFVCFLWFLYWLVGSVKSALNPISEWQTEAAKALCSIGLVNQTFELLSHGVRETHLYECVDATVLLKLYEVPDVPPVPTIKSDPEIQDYHAHTCPGSDYENEFVRN